MKCTNCENDGKFFYSTNVCMGCILLLHFLLDNPKHMHTPFENLSLQIHCLYQMSYQRHIEQTNTNKKIHKIIHLSDLCEMLNTYPIFQHIL